jgi:hypothetical protein
MAAYHSIMLLTYYSENLYYMKKILTVLLGLVSIAAFSQKKSNWNGEREDEKFFRLGAKAGLNINKLQGESYKESFRFNFQLGAFVQFNFSQRFGIQPEVNFVQSSSELSGDATDIADDIFGGGDQNKATLNYLDIPVLLNINIGPSKRVKVQVGPSYGILLKQKVDSVKTNASVYKDKEWSAVGGLWIQLPAINISARYKLGLTDINATGNNETWKNQAIQLSVGFTF